MRLGREGLVIFNEIIECIPGNEANLTEWQQQFISDYSEKVANWDEGAYITSKQLVQVNNIAEALGCEAISEEVLDHD